MESLDLLAQTGWAIRRQHFPPAIRFAYPGKTKAVSVTGDRCELNCAHCGGHYLKGMKALDAIPQDGGFTEARSLLISGGCTRDGRVPVAEHIDRISAIKKDLKCNVHVGLIEEADIRRIALIADKVSFDFVGDDATIREVFGTERTVDDYIACYRLLKNYCPVVPHICIGLHGGQIRGEYQAIRHLKALGVGSVTFIVFTPTRGTAFAGCKPPAIRDVLEVLADARKELPGTPLQLGCMRPGGRYRSELDGWAVSCGVNGIVNPAPEAVRLAKRLGLTIERGEECCVL